jgi:antiviral helicase SLH1
MLTVLRVISQHLEGLGLKSFTTSSIRKSEFKIIYVCVVVLNSINELWNSDDKLRAPMKALASEIVRKFSKRLAWLHIKVRELTGDMQMTRNEIMETQMIVTTPEKWDVVTRKPSGEGEITAVSNSSL